MTQSFRLILMSIFCMLTVCCNNKKDEYASLSTSEPTISGIENSEKATEESIKEENTEINEEGIAVIDEKDSISDIPTAFAIDKNGYYKYKLKLENGKTYKIKTVTNTSSTQRMGKESKTDKTSLLQDVQFKVLQAQNGFYKMQATYTDAKITVTAEGKTLSITPNSPKPNNFLNEPWLLQKYKHQKNITFHLDESGKVSNVQGFSPIYAEIKQEVSKDLKGEELEQFMTYIQQQMSPEMFAATFEQSMLQFPKKGLKINELYTKDNSTKTGKTTYTLTKVSEGKAYIKIRSNTPTQKDTQTTQYGSTITSSLDKSQNGTVVLDTNSGWISSATVTDVNTMKQTESYQGESINLTSTSKSTTTINK